MWYNFTILPHVKNRENCWKPVKANALGNQQPSPSTDGKVHRLCT